MELDKDQIKFFKLIDNFIPPDMTADILYQYKLILQYTALKAQRDQIHEDGEMAKDALKKAFGHG